jgi:hypothetical protein
MQRLIFSPMATPERHVSLSPLPRTPLRPRTWTASPTAISRPSSISSTTLPTLRLRRADLCKASAASREEGDSQPTSAPAAAASEVSSLSELPEYPADFLRRRWITFMGIVLGYSCFYLTRNSLTYTAPAMVADKVLGLSMTDVSFFFSAHQPTAHSFYSHSISLIISKRENNKC